ncbi:energy transducer TonB [Lysobacter sp. MMG2]|uniref:energy transducer TonB n=1 Tax=Lysobacter sp. MMG2 TaxID=2801338 RepID=UPI001C233DE4|nr:energy transducer TonB [Lysobacter sp. MMG2]MBU8978262.1 energy transducer TonB [Lysobacter sp. MMG2]
MKFDKRLCALGLSLCVSVVSAQAPSQPDNAAPSPGKCAPATPMKPPQYPDEASKTLSGTTVLVLSLDPCGVVTYVQVESSSGHAQLDEAAVSAARGWVFEEGEEHRRVRVPVEFSPDGLPPSPLAKADGAQPGAYSIEQALAHYDRMQFSPVQTPAADGTLPVWIEDPLPLDFPTVAENLARLAREGQPEPERDHIRYFRLNDHLRMEAYEVFDDAGWPWAPAMVRRRVVSDGKQSFWASALICEAQRQACAEFEKLMRESDGRQTPTPPAPAPPPGVRRGR